MWISVLRTILGRFGKPSVVGAVAPILNLPGFSGAIVLVPAHIADDAKRSAMAGFLRWMLGPGQRQAAALGYLALSKDVVTKEQDAIHRIH